MPFDFGPISRYPEFYTYLEVNHDEIQRDRVEQNIRLEWHRSQSNRKVRYGVHVGYKGCQDRTRVRRGSDGYCPGRRLQDCRRSLDQSIAQRWETDFHQPGQERGDREAGQASSRRGHQYRSRARRCSAYRREAEPAFREHRTGTLPDPLLRWNQEISVGDDPPCPARRDL